MKKITLVLFLLITLTLQAEPWTVTTLNQGKVNHQAQYIFLKFSKNNQTIYINSVLLYKNHYHAQIIDQEKFFNFFSINQIYKTTAENNGFLGINGGFFTPDNKPLGLLVIDGKTLSNLSPSYLLTGLVLMQDGVVQIVDRKTPYQSYKNVIQTGPFLIDPHGHIGPKIQGKKDRRTILALSDNNDLLVFSVSETTLLDLANLLMQNPKLFGVNKIKVAINLDGGTSTAMSLFLPQQPPLIIPEILPVRSGVIFKLK